MLQYKKRDALPRSQSLKWHRQLLHERQLAGESAMRPYKTHMKNDTEDGEVWRAR